MRTRRRQLKLSQISPAFNMDNITDEEFMSIDVDHIASSASAAAASTSSSTHSRMAPPAASAAPTSFRAAFGAMTNSSLYTSVANMPPLPPPAASVSAPVTSSSTYRNAAPASSSFNTARMPQPSVPSAHSILVSPRQRGNPLLSQLSNVAYEFGPKDMGPDYAIGDTCHVLYLSIKYHRLHTNYISSRLHSLRSNVSAVRILLLFIDADDCEVLLSEITKISFGFGWTIVCCWSAEEAARYLETLKCYEKKTSDMIQERVESDPKSRCIDALTSIRSINKKDVGTLLDSLGSFAAIAKSSKEELLNIPGMGEKKVHRLFHVMNQPFVTSQGLNRPDPSHTQTQSQLDAIHDANIKRAVEARNVVKKGPIQYINSIPLPKQAATTATAPPASASTPIASAALSTSTSNSTPSSSSSTSMDLSGLRSFIS